jgi:N-glycosylase/DNA lyase
MGYKEAGHFLRNIGKSDNKIAILDRHILRNLKELGVIKSEELKGKDSYFEVERKFIDFSDKIGIPIDELDLLFWSRENGEVFK